MDNCMAIKPPTTTTSTTTTTTTTTIKPNKSTAFDGKSFATFAPNLIVPYNGKMTLIIELSTPSPEGLILSQGSMASNSYQLLLGGMYELLCN